MPVASVGLTVLDRDSLGKGIVIDRVCGVVFQEFEEGSGLRCSLEGKERWGG